MLPSSDSPAAPPIPATRRHIQAQAKKKSARERKLSTSARLPPPSPTTDSLLPSPQSDWQTSTALADLNDQQATPSLLAQLRSQTARTGVFASPDLTLEPPSKSEPSSTDEIQDGSYRLDIADVKIAGDDALDIDSYDRRSTPLPFRAPQASIAPESARSPVSDRNSGPLPSHRRTSINAYRSSAARIPEPPLPHHAQAHFYSTPDFDLLGAEGHGTGHAAGDVDLFRAFDSLARTGDTGHSRTDDVLVTGYEGGVTVSSVGKDGLDVIGRLEGLRGGVYAAKIIPLCSRIGALELRRPLIVLVIHGIAPLTQRNQSTNLPHDADLSPSTSHRRTSSRSKDWRNGVLCYQTTVEVYSLLERSHVVTLFTSATVEIPTSPFRPHTAPAPIGALCVDACGQHITVTSGCSGEVYIYKIDEGLAPGDFSSPIRCVGKIWTSVHFGIRDGSSANSSDSESLVGDSEDRASPGSIPLVSLSHRWLAYAPPRPTSNNSMNGTPMPDFNLPQDGNLFAQVAPPQPSISCSADTPDAEGILNRVAREVTQEVIKGARWMGDQGIQAWRNYWYTPPTSAHQTNFKGSMDSRRDQFALDSAALASFPPTHAHSKQPSQPSNETSLVSIVDLEKISTPIGTNDTLRVDPVATFQVPLGCSFLSFAPNGLMLLSASRKGDVQHVWDLMCMIHGRVIHGRSDMARRATSNDDSGQRVRQVARFSRMTVARIVDVKWSNPIGDRLAIVTDKGTVHLFDLPPASFLWPPRRTTRSSAPSEPNSSGVDRESSSADAVPSSTAADAVSAAIQMVNNRAQPLLAAARGRRRSSAVRPSGFEGGKIVSTGLSKSLGAATGTINNIRRVGENRIHLPGGDSEAGTSSVSWLSGKAQHFVGIVGGDILRLHSVERRANGKRHDRTTSVVASKVVEFQLPRPFRNAGIAVADEEVMLEDRGKISGFWNSTQPPKVSGGSRQANLHPLSYAEIESNLPYQPFHTDPRISIYAFNDSGSDGVGAANGAAPAMFGEEIPMTRVDLGTLSSKTEDPSGQQDDQGSRVENILHIDEHNDVEQIVVTSRRRKRTRDNSSSATDDGFFEDDCEVLDFATDRV
ncbi:MAG: hypothetical protein M1825_005383 [Sarcosagium campestre]|nr:MAG: hypothetical protein M1825_005383 [Sarcosagium campestre]